MLDFYNVFKNSAPNESKNPKSAEFLHRHPPLLHLVCSCDRGCGVCDPSVLPPYRRALGVGIFRVKNHLNHAKIGGLKMIFRVWPY